jgi:hypothetical protein
MNSSGDGGDGGSSVVVGPDAVASDNPAGTVLRLNQGFIKPDPGGSYKDIVFDTNGNGETCKCNVALGDGMLNVAGTGAISSNMTWPSSAPHKAPRTVPYGRVAGRGRYARLGP